VDYPVHNARTAFNCHVRAIPDQREFAQAASLSAAKGQRFCPDPYEERPKSAPLEAFRKLIDGWAKWIIVQSVH
jgi:hypothetical protein